MSKKPEWKNHICLHFDDLARILGIEGDVRKVWVEPDNDYVHIQSVWEENGRSAPEGYQLTAPGGSTDITNAWFQR